MSDDRALSVLSGLRADYEEAKAETTKKIAIPGSKGRLLAEYKVIEWSDERRLEKRNFSGGDHDLVELNHMMDQLIAACVQFHYIGPGGGPEPVDPERAVRYDERLADGLGLDVERDDKNRVAARDVVKALFASYEPVPERVPYRIDDHHTAFARWMRGGVDAPGASVEAENDFLAS